MLKIFCSVGRYRSPRLHTESTVPGGSDKGHVVEGDEGATDLGTSFVVSAFRTMTKFN